MALEKIASVEYEGKLVLDITDVFGYDQTPDKLRDVVYGIRRRDQILLMGSIGFRGRFEIPIEAMLVTAGLIPKEINGVKDYTGVKASWEQTAVERRVKRQLFSQTFEIPARTRKVEGKTRYFATLPQTLLEMAGVDGEVSLYIARNECYFMLRRPDGRRIEAESPEQTARRVYDSVMAEAAA